MRQAEDPIIESLCGGGWMDAWKVGSKCDSNLKFTWNSIDNLFHEGGFGFKARFDRCYVRGDAFGEKVRYFGLVGNRPVGSEGQEGGGVFGYGGGSRGTIGDYLSDHFGLVVGLDVAATEPPISEAKESIDLRRENEEDLKWLGVNNNRFNTGHKNLEIKYTVERRIISSATKSIERAETKHSSATSNKVFGNGTPQRKSREEAKT